MIEAQAHVVTAAIEELDASARRHKQAEAVHRRAAKADRQAAERLRADLSRLGIGMEVRRGE